MSDVGEVLLTHEIEWSCGPGKRFQFVFARQRRIRACSGFLEFPAV
jgi:hypothetical protein